MVNAGRGALSRQKESAHAPVHNREQRREDAWLCLKVPKTYFRLPSFLGIGAERIL